MHTFQPCITNLPIDIVLLISEYLDTTDVRQCTRVSIAWNAIFRLRLYHTVKPANYPGFCTFYKTVEQSTKRQKRKDSVPRMTDLGHSVRSLKLQDGWMTVKSMEQLGVLCPNVTSVHFEWTDFINDLKTSSSARRFESPLPLFKRFHPPTLRSLNLKLCNVTIANHNFTSHTMFTILQQVPQLESLTLSDCMTFVTIAFMEQLHDTCPRLKQLVIPAENIQSINDTTVPMETIETVEPARAMERLSMGQYYRSGPALPVFADADAFTGPWFTYITHKYPALKSLTFPSPRFNYTPPNESEDRPNQASSSIVLQDFFPQLHELSLSVFANKPSTAWPQLVRGIQKISLCDDPAAGFSEWISNEATNSLKRLSLSSLPDDLNALRHCPQLQELELGWSRDEESKIKMMLDKRYEVNVDIVLSCCPKLKKLTIASGNLCYDGVNASTTKASLTTMVVKYSVIASNALLDHIGQRCPELVHLDLNDCMWIITDKDPIIRIDLTQHWLTYFRMIDPRVYRETPGSYSGGDQVPIAPNTLFMVKTPDCTVDNPQLFHCGQKNFRQRFVQQFSNPVIARWLNASLGDESDDNSTLHNEAMEVIASLKSDISPYMDYVAQFLELGSENYECAATVLRCHRINRLYYKNRRLCPNPQGSFYAYYC